MSPGSTIDSSPGTRPSTRSVARGLVAIAAVALLAGGYEHLRLYLNGYRFIPTIGTLFLVNAIASTAVGVALLVHSGSVLELTGIAIAGTTLVFFALSRTSNGIFGFAESGLDPAPHAAIALVAEVVVVLTLSTSLARQRRRRG